MDAGVTTHRAEAQLVSLGIGREVFAVPVEAVREILDMRPVFRIPETPAYVLGLIDLRGRSIPVLDLRLKLGLEAIPPTETTRILVLEVAIEGRLLVLGLVADRVIEVLSLPVKDIEPPPDVGVRWRSDYISGVGRRDASFVIIFHLPKLFTAEDLAALAIAA
ncbi:chemotaxis protein CheW [Aquabacter sp. CN5-332]|uniref:chemotaxis protein CheW n=1 Tax=Aquabacter sp. CN5-332 TaxID=3156608 RepID=UPI0032B4CAB6